MLGRGQDLRFGMGMAELRIAEPERRDRLLLISAFAMALLTMLGAAGESLGMDRMLKSNTSKTRTHSLFRQGCMLYELIPNMLSRPLRRVGDQPPNLDVGVGSSNGLNQRLPHEELDDLELLCGLGRAVADLG
jgi:hypothetical protein